MDIIRLSDGACGLSPALQGERPDGGTPPVPPPGQSPPGQQPPPSERPPKPPPLPYKTDFPVTWFGPLGWRYYDANERGIKHFVPGAPYDEPPDASVAELRDAAAARQRQASPSSSSSSAATDDKNRMLQLLSEEGGSRERPLGLIGVVLRRSRRLRRAARWVLNNPARTMLLTWGALMLVCGIIAVLPADVIAAWTSGTEARGAALAIMQSMPLLHSATNTIDSGLRVLRLFGRVPMIVIAAGLMPLAPFLMPLLMPDHTRGLLTLVVLAATGCLATGYLFDDVRFSATSSTLREKLVGRGQLPAYTLLMLSVGGVVVPMLALWVLGQLLPLTVMWFVNGTALPTVLGVLAQAACIAVPVAFFLRYQAEDSARAATELRWRQDPRQQYAGGPFDHQQQHQDEIAALSRRAQDASASRRKLFHVRVFVVSLVIVLVVRELFDFVYPVPGAVQRARALMHRTGAWRPRTA